MKKIPVFFLLVSFFCMPLSAQDEFTQDYKLAMSLLQEGKTDEAIQKLQQLIQIRPNVAQLHSALGAAYLRKPEFMENAIGAFEKAVELDPKFVQGYFNLATIYSARQGNDQEAERYFTKVIELKPDFSQAYSGLGWLYLMHEQNPKKALESFEKSVQLEPNFARAQLGLGLTYVGLGRRADALKPLSVLRSLNQQELAFFLEQTLNKQKPAAQPPLSKTPSVPAAASGNEPTAGKTAGIVPLKENKAKPL